MCLKLVNEDILYPAAVLPTRLQVLSLSRHFFFGHYQGTHIGTVVFPGMSHARTNAARVLERDMQCVCNT
jgi:hypothetical protein